MGLNFKMRHGAIVDNAVAYVYTKFDDDRLLNEKSLADRKSDNKTSKKNNKNNVGGHWGSVPRSINKITDISQNTMTDIQIIGLQKTINYTIYQVINENIEINVLDSKGGNNK